MMNVTKRISGGSRGYPAGKSHVKRKVPPLYGQFSTSFGAWGSVEVKHANLGVGSAHLQNDLEKRHVTIIEINIDVWMRVSDYSLYLADNK
jgi:hypothetical protein